MSLQQLSLGETISRSRTDVNLRRFGIQLLENDSTIVGTGAAPNNAGLYNTYMGWETAQDGLEGTHNTFMGYRAGRRTEVNRGVFLGSRAGEQLWSGSDDNIFIGFESGMQLRGKGNVTLGNYTSESLTGSNNVIIGFSNTTEPTFVMDSVSIGAFSDLQTVGDHQNNTSIGSYSKLLGEISDTVNVGSRNIITQDGTNSVIIGNRITNNGKRSTIIRNNALDSRFDFFQNFQDDYLNIHDTLLGRVLVREDDGGEDKQVSDTTLRGEDVSLVSVPSNTQMDDIKADGTNSHIRVSSDDIHISAKRDINIRGDGFLSGNLDVSDDLDVRGRFKVEGDTNMKGNVTASGIFISDTTPPRRLIEDWAPWDVRPVRGTETAIENFQINDASFIRIKNAVILRFNLDFDVIDQHEKSKHQKKQKKLARLQFSLPSLGRPSIDGLHLTPARFYKYPGESVFETKTGGKIRFISKGSCTGNAFIEFQEDQSAVLVLKLDAFLPGKWNGSGSLSYPHQPDPALPND